jgi:hypothetical protein
MSGLVLRATSQRTVLPAVGAAAHETCQRQWKLADDRGIPVLKCSVMRNTTSIRMGSVRNGFGIRTATGFKRRLVHARSRRGDIAHQGTLPRQVDKSPVDEQMPSAAYRRALT